MSAFIYVIGRQQGPVKIGITKSLGSRLSALQTGCPFKLSLLAAYERPSWRNAKAHELFIHGGMEDMRLQGEWFRCDADYAAERIEDSVHMCVEVFGDYPI